MILATQEHKDTFFKATVESLKELKDDHPMKVGLEQPFLQDYLARTEENSPK